MFSRWREREKQIEISSAYFTSHLVEKFLSMNRSRESLYNQVKRAYKRRIFERPSIVRSVKENEVIKKNFP